MSLYVSCTGNWITYWERVARSGGDGMQRFKFVIDKFIYLTCVLSRKLQDVWE